MTRKILKKSMIFLIIICTLRTWPKIPMATSVFLTTTGVLLLLIKTGNSDSSIQGLNKVDSPPMEYVRTNQDKFLFSFSMYPCIGSRWYVSAYNNVVQRLETAERTLHRRRWPLLCRNLQFDIKVQVFDSITNHRRIRKVNSDGKHFLMEKNIL